MNVGEPLNGLLRAVTEDRPYSILRGGRVGL
jgi:hypothetical protein